MESQISNLPENVRITLADFVDAAKTECSGSLSAIVLYGSAAEGRLRPTSDVNLILVFREFNVPQIDRLREKLRVAYAAIRLNVMFILDSEVLIASEFFAVKFTDILSRNRILFGSDPFKNIEVSRSATLQRLRQVVVNLTLRLRERYALVSLREEQLMPIIADVTGPIRACAATILSLQGKKTEHPKEALQILVQAFSGGNWTQILKNMSLAREEQQLKPGDAASTLLGILELLKAMQKQIQGLS